MENAYLKWLVRETPTTWWHDSAVLNELHRGLDSGATGVTTNPVLISQALRSTSDRWTKGMRIPPGDLKPEQRAEILIEKVVKKIAGVLHPEYQRSSGQQGYVCAQVNPTKAADAESMLSMARRFSGWAPNIAVKLPATAAGLEAAEECAAAGITVAVTVSFTVSQAIAVAERYRKGIARAREANRPTGQCFTVIMLGRLDDYLRDVARDQKAPVSESDIRMAGLAVTKRAYRLYQQQGYSAKLLVAALRGIEHATELSGAGLILSIHPKIQALLRQPGVPEKTGIDKPVLPEIIRRLKTVSEFVRAYEPEGMVPEEFITYGVTQRTLSQFTEAGWSLIESFSP